jgi:hypothetical protein
MSTVTGSVKVNISGSQTPGTLPGTVTPVNVNQTFNCNFATSGTTADSVDLMHVKTYSFAASTAQTLDLTSLTDVYGGAVAFARVRAIEIKVKSTTDGATLTLSPGASNGWTNFLGTSSTLILQASTSSNDAGFVVTAPNTTGWVVDSTHKTLTLTPSAHAYDVDVQIMGASA